jgi:restriction system protein
MTRHRSFASAIVRASREAARAQARAQRASVAAAKRAKQQHLESRAQEAESRNDELQANLTELATILQDGLTNDPRINFQSLKADRSHPGRRPFDAPPHLAAPVPRPALKSFTSSVSLAWWEKLLPGAAGRLQRRTAAAHDRFEHTDRQWQSNEDARAMEYRRLEAEHEKQQAAVAEHDQQIDAYAASYRAGEVPMIAGYSDMVLERSAYPEGCPQQFRIAYVPASRQLVIEYELPGPQIIPAAAEFRYVKAKDQIEEKPRKSADIKERYSDVIASIALRTLHEVFVADAGNHLDMAVFNGFVNAVDPATGHDIRPCLISVSAAKKAFTEIDLTRVDRRVCLRNLGAQVSSRPDAVQPVKPIVEFDMVDRRFVDQSDVISELESRPNLLELNPFEFENLVGNLFSKMGLETKQTRASRDGGVDVVAFDARPVLGGKVVIQAKRYRHTVGVAAVRDLYGTMINEGASKGILVTTSGYGPDAFEFAKDKPMELIEGGGLLYLLENHANVKARIVFPDEGAS